MANAKDLRKRITSVKNTQQITKAMKMVSAAKLRRAQSNIVSLRPFANELKRMIHTLTKNVGDQVASPLLEKREGTKVLLVLVSSDKGLCGAFNGNVVKTAARFMKESQTLNESVDLAFVGKKGFEFFKSKKEGKYYQGFLNKLDFKKCQDFAKELIAMYLEEKYDRIFFIYNEFKSAISQKVEIERFLPVQAEEIEETSAEANLGLTIYEPSAQGIFDELLPKHFSTQVYRVMLESIASEHAARMSAMENATKNAGEMMKKLSLEYNKTRQAGITKELLEIVSGAEALKG